MMLVLRLDRPPRRKSMSVAQAAKPGCRCLKVSGISFVSTTRTWNTCHSPQAKGVPRITPVAQEPRKIPARSRRSSRFSRFREAPRARNTPVSRDFCQKKRPTTQVANTAQPMTAKAKIIITCPLSPPSGSTGRIVGGVHHAHIRGDQQHGEKASAAQPGYCPLFFRPRAAYT